MHTRVSIFLIVIAFAIVLSGCPSTQQTQTPPKPVAETKPTAPAKPAAKKFVLTFRIGSIDLTKGTGFKIERSHLEEMAAFAKREALDVVTMQGVARYPGLTTRVDIVETFAAISNMAPAFGENTTISGRQTGNAIFTRFPIISRTNTPFQGLHSTGFESALQATVDFGESQIVLVSTELPTGVPRNEILSCLSSLEQFRSYYISNPIFVAGNLPKDEMAKQFAMFKGVNPQGAATAPRIWYSAPVGSGIAPGMTIEVIEENTRPSPLGVATVAEFGLYK